jgi:glycosyltransferase involved in cell wall biosynthesis
MSPELSVVIPVRNEAPALKELHRELTQTLSAGDRPYEIIVVDDGSTDESFDLLARLQATDPRLRVIRFRRNFGQTAAFAAGFDNARGRVIITMDGDLQNDPRDIPRLVEKLEQGYDIVCGWRKDRKDPFFSRRLPSLAANKVISVATGVRLHDYGCSLKAFRAEVIKPLKLYGEMHRFLPAIASEFGVTIGEKVVTHHARTQGKSNYGITRTFRVVLDLMTVKFLSSYSTRPLQMFGSLGIGAGVLGTLICAYVTYLKFFGHQWADRQWTLQLGILLVFIGVQLLTIGLVAEMVARTYHESQDKPVYVIREIRESQPERSLEKVGA